jgi:hypothetical protein
MIRKKGQRDSRDDGMRQRSRGFTRRENGAKLPDGSSEDPSSSPAPVPAAQRAPEERRHQNHLVPRLGDGIVTEHGRPPFYMSRARGDVVTSARVQQYRTRS